MTILQVLFLAAIFPFLLKRGRQAYNVRATVQSDTRAEESLVATPAESSVGGERAPLLARSPESDEDLVEAAVEDKVKETSNYFDVCPLCPYPFIQTGKATTDLPEFVVAQIIILGVSNVLEALSWSGIAVASNWQVLLGGACLLPFPSTSLLHCSPSTDILEPSSI